MEVVLAFSDLGGDLSGYEATFLAQDVLLNLHPNWKMRPCPLTRGGRDFAPTVSRAFFGRAEMVAVLGPRGEPEEAELGMLSAEDLPQSVRNALRLPPDGMVAIIEAASACGLHRVPATERNPLDLSSIGVGQLIARAADRGARAIIIAGGDLATIDLGLGALEAMGLEPLAHSGQPLHRITPRQWPDLGRLSGEIWPHIPAMLYIYDGDYTLLGPSGTVTQRGRTVGLLPHQLADYERALGGAAKKLCASFEKPRNLMAQRGSGDGGGLSLALQVACDAEMMAASDFLPIWQGWRRHWAEADLVVVGCAAASRHSLEQPVLRQALIQAEALSKPVFLLAESADPNLILPPKSQLHLYAPNGTLKEAVNDQRRKLLTHKLVNLFKK